MTSRTRVGCKFVLSRLLATIALFAASTVSTYAQTNWTGAFSNGWFNVLNWTAGVPSTFSSVNIDTVTPNSTEIRGTGAIAQNLAVGQNGTGLLTIRMGGTLTNSFGVIGNLPGSTGTVIVTDAGSNWMNVGSIVTGGQGTGTFIIQNGGTVNSGGGSVGLSVGSTGTVTVTDAGSRWINGPSNGLNIGSFGTGTLTITNGGSVIDIAIQFLGHVNAIRPYGSADLHLSPNTVLEYSYATSLPRTRDEKGFDSSPADRTETDPRVSLTGFSPRIESAHHQELSLSRHMGRNSVQAAVFTDRISNTALTGVGFVTAASGDLLPDTYSGTFSYAGGRLDTAGMRVVLQRKFSSDLTGTLDYAYGGVLDLDRPDVSVGDAHNWISAPKRHAVAAKFGGAIPRTRTSWIASYRWVSGSALTPVDMFNASPGQADPYLNLFVRQPLPNWGFLPHMEALIDLRNLLAQGYVPVVGQDGQTVYLVQAARSVRGGVAFSF